MTFEEFHNGIRVLFNIDKGKFHTSCGHSALWCKFTNDPIHYFLRCNDDEAKALFSIIIEKNKNSSIVQNLI